MMWVVTGFICHSFLAATVAGKTVSSEPQLYSTHSAASLTGAYRRFSVVVSACGHEVQNREFEWRAKRSLVDPTKNCLLRRRNRDFAGGEMPVSPDPPRNSYFFLRYFDDWCPPTKVRQNYEQVLFIQYCKNSTKFDSHIFRFFEYIHWLQ